MKFLKLAYKNLHRRRIRSLLTVGGVSVAVAVLVSLLGFQSGYQEALNKDVQGLGYQVLVTAKGCPYELGALALAGTGAIRYLSDQTIARVEEDKEVSEITPILMHPLIKETGDGFYTFWGIDLESYSRLRPTMKIGNGKHKEIVTDPATGKESEIEADGPFGRWFEERDVMPDEIHLKNGRIAVGLIVGKSAHEKVVRQDIDLESGELVQVKENVESIKIQLPVRNYEKRDVLKVSALVTFSDGKSAVGEIVKASADQFSFIDGSTGQKTLVPAGSITKVQDALELRDGRRVIGTIILDAKDTIDVANVDLAYPETREIETDIVEKVVDNDGGEIVPEIVVGYETAQVGNIAVGQLVHLRVKETVKEKVKVKDPATGQEVEQERESPGIMDYKFRVVGILDRTGTKDDSGYILQLQEGQRIFRKFGLLTWIGIRLHNLERLPAFTDRLYNAKDLGEIQVISLAEVRGTILNLVTTAKILIMSVAFIAIFVALIGVVNTILMSVFERTQEIGIMKAIGASKLDIFRLIWLETLIICVLGGIGGILIAVIGGNVIESLIRNVMSKAGYVPAGKIIRFTWQILFGSFVGAIVLGIVSGVWPAYRASAMRPIEAIRSGE